MKKRLGSRQSRFLLIVLVMPVAGCLFQTGNEDNKPSLSWHAPLHRVDGRKLYPGEIQGYRVYFRRSEEASFEFHFIDSAHQTSWTPSRLDSGDYSFAVSTIDTAGLESPRSETLRVTIP